MLEGIGNQDTKSSLWDTVPGLERGWDSNVLLPSVLRCPPCEGTIVSAHGCVARRHLPRERTQACTPSIKHCACGCLSWSERRVEQAGRSLDPEVGLEDSIKSEPRMVLVAEA